MSFSIIDLSKKSLISQSRTFEISSSVSIDIVWCVIDSSLAIKLSLKYKRTSSYKSGSKATYIITVDKNLQITEKHYGSYFKKD